MNVTVIPGMLRGQLKAVPSKSHAHRAMICAALADGPTELLCRETNGDIEATAKCLNALGASVIRTQYGYQIHPVTDLPESVLLHCGESGATLRFLLPLMGVLGVDARFCMEGRLPQRPLSPLWEEMERMGCRLTRPTESEICCQGRLSPGCYHIPGNISSQYITGLLLALIHLEGYSEIRISGKLESKPYVDLTLSTLAQFGIIISADRIPGKQLLHSPGKLPIEGDWSNAAFYLAANYLGNNIQLEGLSQVSPQGDREIEVLLPCFQDTPQISAADIPDLIPILSVVAATNKGAVFTDIQRLRIKESDRVDAILAMIRGLGGKAEATSDTLTVIGTGLIGGTVDAYSDHRIAMSTAIAATVCKKPVSILGADCVQKSYPRFWEDYRSLGGQYEQYIR